MEKCLVGGLRREAISCRRGTKAFEYLGFGKLQADSKISIPLTFLKDYPSMSSENITPYWVTENRVWMYHAKHDYQIFMFDIDTRNVMFMTSASNNNEILYTNKSSLLHVKGIRPLSKTGKNFICKR